MSVIKVAREVKKVFSCKRSSRRAKTNSKDKAKRTKIREKREYKNEVRMNRSC